MIYFRVNNPDRSVGKAFTFDPIEKDAVNYNLTTGLPLYAIIDATSEESKANLIQELKDDMKAMGRDENVLNNVTGKYEYRELSAKIPKSAIVFHLGTKEGFKFGKMSVEERRQRFETIRTIQNTNKIAVANEYTAV
jgi:hypothetical protein